MTKGLRQFLDPEQQQAWLEGKVTPPDTDERSESLEHRFKYIARFDKLLQRPQAQDVLDILRLYGATCIPIPRTTERWYWSVSCLPSSPDKPLVRISASFMELFALHADGDTLRARFILHLSDFTIDGSSEPEQLDTGLLESCAVRPEDVTYAIWRNARGILIAKVRARRLDPPVHRAPARAPRHPQLQPHPHEPRPQRLSGEPLPQPRGRDAGGMIGDPLAPWMHCHGSPSGGASWRNASARDVVMGRQIADRGSADARLRRRSAAALFSA